MLSEQPVDRGVTWHLPQLHDLRFMRARYVQYAFKPHAHDYYVLGMIETGLQSFTYKRERLVTSPGKLILINPGEVHTGEPAISGGFTYRALYPSLELMESITNEFSIKPARIPGFVGGVTDDRVLFQWIRYLHRISEQPEASLELEDGLTHFFVTLIKRHAKPSFTLKPYRAAHQAIALVCDYMEAYYAENITLADLSAMVNISVFHLARLFQKRMGIPPHKYLENVRVRHAERLLMSGMPIAEVAYATGFSSQSHLTRTFKQFLGTTPGEFAKQRKNV